MKKISLILGLAIYILFISSCKKEEPIVEDNPEPISFTTLSVNVQLPSGTNFNADDLKVSSLFSENVPLKNSSGTLESFDGNTMELSYATNTQGNIVLLSYFNPIDNESVTMNSTTTAIALVMLHPWSFDLSPNAKKEAGEYIKSLPEFSSYLLAVENSIANGNLNPLESQTVLDKLGGIQNIVFQKITESKEPLQFIIENSTAKVINVSSSASYSVGLYDNNNVLFKHKLAQGLEKSHYLFSDFTNGTFENKEKNEQTVSINIPTDGNWTLKAKNGLSFDGSLENQQAAYHNTKTVVANILGIFSTKLKTLITKNECYISIGDFVYNGVSGSIDISTSIEEYSKKTKSGYVLTKDILKFTWDKNEDILGLIENCSNGADTYGLDKLKKGVFGKIMSYLDVLSRLENVFNSTAMLTDWVQFDSEIELCFKKTGNDIEKCKVKIGDFYAGGIVFKVDAAGEHGLVCAPFDQSSGATFYEGINICESLTLNGYSDWTAIYTGDVSWLSQNYQIINASSIQNGGSAFTKEWYWTGHISPPQDNYDADVYSIITGSGYPPGYFDDPQDPVLFSDLYAVRAVRSF